MYLREYSNEIKNHIGPLDECICQSASLIIVGEPEIQKLEKGGRKVAEF